MARGSRLWATADGRFWETAGSGRQPALADLDESPATGVVRIRLEALTGTVAGGTVWSTATQQPVAAIGLAAGRGRRVSSALMP